MALFTLRTGYRVETTPTGGRVVHVRTGDALELNFVEVQLLARAAAGGLAGEDPAFRPVIRKLTSLGLLEKVASGEDMKVPPPPGAKYTSGLWILPGKDPLAGIKDPPPAEGEPRRVSVDPDPPVLELISSEMPVTMLSESLAPNEPEPEPAQPSKGSDAEVSFEMLPPSPEDEPVAEADQVTLPAPDVKEPQTEPAPAGPPPPPNPDEPVPTFRADLKLTSHAGGLYDVTDTARGKTFSFYDFELSIARMLNGRRSYKEVVVAANRLGIPVNLESLGQFVRQVERYGFVAPKGTKLEVAPEDSIWGKREKWDEGVRTLFQSGLRLTRHARYREAAPYFEAILQNDPENPEPLEVRPGGRRAGRRGGAAATRTRGCASGSSASARSGGRASGSDAAARAPGRIPDSNSACHSCSGSGWDCGRGSSPQAAPDLAGHSASSSSDPLRRAPRASQRGATQAFFAHGALGRCRARHRRDLARGRLVLRLAPFRDRAGPAAARRRGQGRAGRLRRADTRPRCFRGRGRRA